MLVAAVRIKTLPLILLIAAVVAGVACLVAAVCCGPQPRHDLLSACFTGCTFTAARTFRSAGRRSLVCNHVSYIDFLLLCVAEPRYIRFVFFAGWTKVLFIRHLLCWGRAIPIDATSGPKAILKSLRSAGEALNENDLVCIFAEGRFSARGFLLPFHRGFEQIVKDNQARIIPVCLDELWGSIFSFYGDRTLWKLPRRIPYPTSVAFGKPMPATSTAAEVRQAVQQLAADCAVARSNRCRAIPREFIRTAARHPFRPCIIEQSRPNVSVGTAILGATGSASAPADSPTGTGKASGTQTPAVIHRYHSVLARAIDLSRRLNPKTLLTHRLSPHSCRRGFTPSLPIWRSYFVAKPF